MAQLQYRLIPQGYIGDFYVPLNVAIVSVKGVEAAGLDLKAAAKAIGESVPGGCCIDIIDKDSITVTTDGIICEGAVVAIAATYNGLMNANYGFSLMVEIPHDEETIKNETPLAAWDVLWKGRKLYRGPLRPANSPVTKYNFTATGRCCNCNSGSELFDLVTMREIIIPHTALLACYDGKKAMIGRSGDVMSVGIGMLVPESKGRITRVIMCQCGDTLHRCGEDAKKLKRHIPAILCDKRDFAERVLQAMDAGMEVCVNLSCSPTNLMIARLSGHPANLDRITDRAWLELNSVGFTREYLESIQPIPREELLSRANELLPCLEDSIPFDTSEVVKTCTIEVA